MKTILIIALLTTVSCTTTKESCWGNKKMNYYQGYSPRKMKV